MQGYEAQVLQLLQPQQNALVRGALLPLRGPRLERCPEVLWRPLELRRAYKRQVILHQVL
jgi:hypothetical protein